MALIEITELGKITINHQTGGHCEIQEVIKIIDDVTLEVKSEKFHRLVLEPGDNTSAIAKRVKHITDGAWTPKLKADWATRKANAKANANANIP